MAGNARMISSRAFKAGLYNSRLCGNILPADCDPLIFQNIIPWINWNAVQNNFVMYMRSGASASASDKRHNVAASYFISYFYQIFGVMGKPRNQPVTMVNFKNISISVLTTH